MLFCSLNKNKKIIKLKLKNVKRNPLPKTRPKN